MLSKYTKKSREKIYPFLSYATTIAHIVCYCFIFKFYIFLSLHYFKIHYLYIIPNKRNMNLRIRRSIPTFFNMQRMSYTKLPTYIEVYNHYIFIKTNDSKSAKNETI